MHQNFRETASFLKLICREGGREGEREKLAYLQLNFVKTTH